MPQASTELRDKMKEYFGDTVDDKGPMDYLSKQGYTFLRNGMILSPVSRTNSTRTRDVCVVTRKEWDCLLYLCDEWDHAWEFNAKVSTV